MAITLSKKDRHEVTIKHDEEPKTVFHLRPLPYHEKQRLVNQVAKLSSKDDNATAVELMTKIVNDSLVGWSGVFDDDGNDVPFPGNEEAINALTTEQVADLFTEIQVANRVVSRRQVEGGPSDLAEDLGK